MKSKKSELFLIERILVLIGRKKEDSSSIFRIYVLLCRWFDKHTHILDSLNTTKLNSNFRFACILAAVSAYENLPNNFFKALVPESVFKICSFISSYIDPESIAA